MQSRKKQEACARRIAKCIRAFEDATYRRGFCRAKGQSTRLAGLQAQNAHRNLTTAIADALALGVMIGGGV